MKYAILRADREGNFRVIGPYDGVGVAMMAAQPDDIVTPMKEPNSKQGLSLRLRPEATAHVILRFKPQTGFSLEGPFYHDRLDDFGGLIEQQYRVLIAKLDPPAG